MTVPASPWGDPAQAKAAPRDGRLFITLPRLLRERLRRTLASRGWLDADGRPERGAEVEVVAEWLMEYALLKHWTGEALPAPGFPSSDLPLPSDEPAADDDFGFRD